MISYNSCVVILNVPLLFNLSKVHLSNKIYIKDKLFKIIWSKIKNILKMTLIFIEKEILFSEGGFYLD